jgi:SAM-dependent methyltransferase
MIFSHRNKASKIIIILRVLIIIYSYSEIFHLIDGFTLVGDRYSALSSSLSLSSSSSTAIKSYVDVSSTEYWEEFYRKEEEEKGQEETSSSSSSTSTTTPEKEAVATEWHSSISLDDIASVVPQNGRCLIIGCGNSLLPDVILQRQDQTPGPPRSLVLLDSSPTCLDQLRERYSKIEDTEIYYICGDATKLSKYFDIDDEYDNNNNNNNNDDDNTNDLNNNNYGNNRRRGDIFDIIIDKGLTDAILCGEGWDYLLEKVLYESSKILSKDGSGGRYLLISYQLPSSTKDFLIDVGKKVGLEWEFDFDLNSELTPTTTTTPDATSEKPSSSSYQYMNKKHPRVSVAMATRINKDIIK